MKKLTVMFVMILALIMPITTNAGDCSHYFEELVGQSFEVTVDDIDYTLYFGQSVYGPCPGGVAILSYEDIQIINDIEYTAYLEFECGYTTTSDIVSVEGLDFILINGKLILLPDDPLILEVVEED